MRGKLFTVLLAGIVLTTPFAASVSGQSNGAGPSDFVRWCFGPARILMTPAELELLESIDGSGLEGEFIDWFWSRRDPVPNTAANEFRREFSDRLAFVNKEFAEAPRGVPGWATPRGQVYLLMGAPEQTLRTQRRFFVDGALRRLTIWEYRHPLVGTARFNFVQTNDGVLLAGEGRAGRMPAVAADAIVRQRNRLIANDDPGRFGKPVDRRTDSLVLEATLSPDGDGVLARVSLTLADLFGEPADNAIRYRFAITAKVDDGLRSSRHRNLGTIAVLIGPEDFRNRSDQALNIALWVPAQATELRITEVPTGRTATISAKAARPLDPELPIGRKLAVASLLNGSGVAVAYFPTSIAHPAAEAILVDAAHADTALTQPLPGGRFALALPPGGSF